MILKPNMELAGVACPKQSAAMETNGRENAILGGSSAKRATSNR
jgi:hypothetical protein